MTRPGRLVRPGFFYVFSIRQTPPRNAGNPEMASSAPSSVSKFAFASAQPAGITATAGAAPDSQSAPGCRTRARPYRRDWENAEACQGSRAVWARACAGGVGRPKFLARRPPPGKCSTGNTCRAPTPWRARTGSSNRVSCEGFTRTGCAPRIRCSRVVLRVDA